MLRAMALLFFSMGFSTTQAAPARAYAFIGGWAYDISGTFTNTSELDLQDDLGLQPTARENYVLGYTPAKSGWIPALEFDYTRIAADGQQRFQTLPTTGLEPVTGIVVPTETVVDDRTSVNDFELTARWPWQIGAFTLLGGITLTTLNGSIMVADESNGQRQTQNINETFPLLSAGVEWQPIESLRLSLSGDYVQYDGNRADELEARLLWKFLGPIGLEGGYRQRRYKINEPMARLDATVSGARIGLVMEIPFGDAAKH